MATTKVAITLDSSLLTQLDQLVAKQVFPSRSQAIQAALRDKLARLNHSRLEKECDKLDPAVEQAMAEEGMELELENWPIY